MKKIFIALVIVLAVAISACSLQDYLPDSMLIDNTSNETTLQLLNDSFEFVDEPVQEEQSELQEESEDLDALNETTDEEEPLQDELVFATITVTEGDIVSLLDLQAEDPDGDIIDFEYSSPFDGDGLWQTNEGDAGKYLTTIKATDGVLSTTERIQIVVLPTNKGPVVNCPEEFEVQEGELIDLPCIIFDKEGDEVTFTVTGFMDELTYQTGYQDAGEHTVIVSASDGQRTTVEEIQLTILPTNRPPQVTVPSKFTVQETQPLTLTLLAMDPDGDTLTMAYPPLFDENGVWQTEKGDAGLYELEVVVSDGVNDVTVPLHIEVENFNVPPELEPIGLVLVDEGDLITLDIEAEDLDGDNLTITISGFMTETTYQTDFDDAGEYWVLVEVADQKHVVEENVSIIINNVNRPPVFKLYQG
jgi:hypothetical protein